MKHITRPSFRRFVLPSLFVCAVLGCDGNPFGSGQEADEGCEFMGERYETGEEFPAGDSCNMCSCNPNGNRPGEVECSLKACVDCSACTTDELCVVDYDANCVDIEATCVTSSCNDTCSAACDSELCDGAATCQPATCPTLPIGAYQCKAP